MDLDLRSFLKLNSLFEKSEEVKYKYKDSNGNDIIVKKDEDGNITKIGPDGKKVKATASELSDAKRSVDKEKRKKEALKAAKKVVKQEKRAERREAIGNNVEKHLDEFGKELNSTLKEQFGVLGSVLSIVGSLVVGTIYNAGKDIKKHNKEKRAQKLALLKLSNDTLDKDTDAIENMSEEEMEEYNKLKDAYDKVMSSSYNDKGELVDDKEFEKNLKSTFNDDEEYNKFVDDAKELVNKDSELDSKLDKFVEDADGPILDELKSNLEKDSKEAKNRIKEKEKIEKEYKEKIDSIENEYKTSKESLSNIKNSISKSNDNLDKQIKDKQKGLEELKKNKPKDVSDEKYKSELDSLENDIFNTQKENSNIKSKAEEKTKKSEEDIEDKHNKELEDAKIEYKNRLKSAGIKTAETAKEDAVKQTGDKEKAKKINKDIEVVKDKDGSEIISRKKKRGEGITYVRKRGGEEVGGATKDEFLAAKQNQEKEKKEQNESFKSSNKIIGKMDLMDFLKEEKDDNLINIKKKVDKVKSEIEMLKNIKKEIDDLVNNNDDDGSSKPALKDSPELEKLKKLSDDELSDVLAELPEDKRETLMKALGLSSDKDKEKSGEENSSDDEDLGNPNDMDDDEKEEFGEDFVDMLKEDPDSIDEILDMVDKDTKTPEKDKEKLKENLKKIAQDVKDGKYDEEESDSGEEKEKNESLKENFVTEGHGSYAVAGVLGLCMGGVGVVPMLALNAIRRHVGKKKVKRTIKRMEKAVNSAQDESTKKELQKQLDDYKKARYDKDGQICVSKHAVKKNIARQQANGNLSSDYNIDSMKSTQKDAKKNKKMAQKQEKAAWDEQKDDIRTAEDGSTIEPRKKKNGKGITYVRKKDGKEIGYATKDDYMTAKSNKKNESLSSTLKSTITESFKDYIKNKI